MANMSRLNLS